MAFDQAAFRREKAEEEAQKANWTAFDHFWNAYPVCRRIGKAKTRRLFDRITSPGGTTTRSLIKDSGTYETLELEATPEQLIEAARKYNDSVRKKHDFGYQDDGKYVLHPVTFLNSGRYEDFL